MAASTNETSSIDTAITKVISQLENISALKDEQRTALEAFLSGKDVFALLPTGFGKSLIYQLAPLVAKEMGTKPNPILIVVSPLVALIADQIKEATKLGLKALQLSNNAAHDDIIHGRCQLVFGSPSRGYSTTNGVICCPQSCTVKTYWALLSMKLTLHTNGKLNAIGFIV